MWKKLVIFNLFLAGKYSLSVFTIFYLSILHFPQLTIGVQVLYHKNAEFFAQNLLGSAAVRGLVFCEKRWIKGGPSAARSGRPSVF